MKIWLAAALLTLQAPIGLAEGIDCAVPNGDVERLICNDPELFEMDARLSIVASQKSAESPYFEANQNSWLVTRDRCEDRECLVGLYSQRIRFLLPASAESELVTNEPDAHPNDFEPTDGIQMDVSTPEGFTPVDAEELEAHENMVAQAQDIPQAAPLQSAPTAPVATANHIQLWSTPAGKSVLLLFVGLISAVLFLILLSALGVVVCYFDAPDFGWSLAPAAAALVTALTAWALADGTNNSLNSAQTIALVLGSLVASCFTLVSITKAIRYNRSIVAGVVIGFFKVGIAPLMVFSLLANDGRRYSAGYYRYTIEARQQRANAARSFVILGFLWLWLVNGERVYERKGWTLPSG